MANTKKTVTDKKNEAKAKEPVSDIETTLYEEKEPAPKPSSRAKKKPLPMPADDVRLRVRSNQYGRLCFINSRNGEQTEWHDINDIQEIKVADLRDIKSNSPRFLEETWIVIEEIEEPEYADLTVDEIYDVLGISRFASTGRPRYMSDILEWDRFEIGKHIDAMSRNTKDNVALALNTEIRRGRLTDLQVINAWQQALGIQLDIDMVGEVI